MIAASFWSLLAPAIELAESSGDYGADGRYSFVPVAIGFLLGAVFVYATDRVSKSSSKIIFYLFNYNYFH